MQKVQPQQVEEDWALRGLRDRSSTIGILMQICGVNALIGLKVRPIKCTCVACNPRSANTTVDCINVGIRREVERDSFYKDPRNCKRINTYLIHSFNPGCGWFRVNLSPDRLACFYPSELEIVDEN